MVLSSTLDPSLAPSHLRTLALYVLGGLVFALLATANAGGYRYGGADQAFYIPAITHVLDPGTFPRDGALIDAQAALTVVDEVLAGAARATGWSLETLFFLGYLLSLALIWISLVLIGERVYASGWITCALGAAFTMRHRIARTSANTFEPYFHPRMLAFALGLIAIAALLRHRRWLAVGLVAAAAVIHTTTAIWFAVLLGVALALLDSTFRRLAYVAVLAAAVGLTWAVATGPLRTMATTMDSVWLQALASKDSLFADQWPLWAWLTNLGLIAVLGGAHYVRRRQGTATPADHALICGATTLVVLFLATLPFVMARLSVVVEFQISRVFWLVDLLATVYLLAALAEVRGTGRLTRTVAVALIALSSARGIYVGFFEHPERALLAIHTPPSPWEDAMQWLSQQPHDSHVLADPGHSWKYGTSVRVTGKHDVLLEEVKDSAIAIYSRDVAARVVERTGAIDDFTRLTAERALALANQYDLDLLVTEADLRLPVEYRNSQFRIYSLRQPPSAR